MTSAKPEPLSLAPVSVSDACEFVDQHHRHHRPPPGGLFAVGVARGELVLGVAIVGRPVARNLDDGWTAEVTRCAVRTDLDGAADQLRLTRNACSMLYSACWRAARALGFRRVITYTLASESGGSLRAAGWRVVGQVRGRSWHCPSRPRVDRHPLQDKLRWEAPDATD